MQAVIKIHLYGAPYTVCYISEDQVTLPDAQYYKLIGVEPESVGEIPTDIKKGTKFTTKALFLRPFLQCLKSEVYRRNVAYNLNRICGWPASGTALLKLILEPPDLEIIDHVWNDKVLRLIWTRVEIENAFSWLSTLGGAYSALGDYFEHCAEEAGRISVRQYKLSKMLGDDSLAARSKLYSALALSQKGHLRRARHLVRKINDFAIQTHDKRLNRMCQGVWAKLKYLHSLNSNRGDGKNM